MGTTGTTNEHPDQQPPQLRVVTDDSTGHPKMGLIRISKETFDVISDVYLKGTRTASGLARACKINKKTAERIINVGYPNKGWPALKERATLWDKAKRDEETRAHAQQARAAIDGRSHARKEREGILRLGKAGYATLFHKWQEDAQRATFGPKGKVKVKTAAGVEEVDTVSATNHVLAGVRLMQGWSIFAAEEERQLTEGSGQGDSTLPAGMPPGLANLSKEDLDYVVANGKLPAHLDEHEVLGIRPAGK